MKKYFDTKDDAVEFAKKVTDEDNYAYIYESEFFYNMYVVVDETEEYDGTLLAVVTPEGVNEID
jgi:hypothetical protein